MSLDRNVEVSLTAVLVLDGPAAHAPCTLELRGPLDAARLDAALDRIAADRPELRHRRPHTERRGPHHHVLHTPAPAANTETEAAAETAAEAEAGVKPGAGGGCYPLGALADLLTAAPPDTPDISDTSDTSGTSGTSGASGALGGVAVVERFALTPLQHDLLADEAACPHRQVAQLVWRWHGPLDTGRFTAAWQRVFDHESVLRTAFVWTPQPRLALHERARPDVVRHPYGALTRQELIEQERGRGFDLARPGLLRTALLDGGPHRPPGGHIPPTDIVLTYHRGLLDGRSVHLLLQEFYRAYLAAGAPLGGERRPDLRDYRRWLAGQDVAPARELWRRTGGALRATLPRARPGAVTGRHGSGRTLARLTRAEALRLTRWAGRWGAAESSALQAVWAMVLYRAGGVHRGRLPVSFGVTVSGRGIPMEGVARLPGPLDNPLPMVLDIDPAGTVPALLRAVRDRALDLAAYEWVSAGQIRQWLGPHRAPELPHTLLSVDHPPRPPGDLAAQLAAHGIHVEDADPAAVPGAFPLGVLAHHDSSGGLVLSAVHDRARLGDDQVAQLIAHSARLLRQLPDSAGEDTTIAQALAPLTVPAGTDPPRLHDPLPDRVGGRLAWLREAREPGAAVVCLIAPPAAGDAGHGELARRYGGPEALTALCAHPARLSQCLAALRPLLGARQRLVLGGYSGSGALALELARHIAAAGHTAPPVVLGPGPAGEGAADLARALAAACRP
ncbi:condensation domain-containing protein [Streptomyces sp. NPDC050658]|uniref:condensation domain-containing protein n=1 Tax=unclassified Streptomyces TaxID=2593676 RepID=UPI00344ACA38